jgi:GT2 family glycosyltransferase
MPFKIVTLSKRPENLIPFVESIYRQDPTIPRENIVVVNDGARAEAEIALPGITWVEGEKPFVFSRNANIGILAADSDVVILCNDDITLQTQGGFTKLATVSGRFGLTSAAIHGPVGNPTQSWVRGDKEHGLREEHILLCFVCVAIPRFVWDTVGPLDERFVGYGYEDDDYSKRVQDAGQKLYIYDGCVVQHGGIQKSTFRDQYDESFVSLMAQSKKAFKEKWGESLSLRLNLGCSDAHVSGYTNVDLAEPADVIADLSKPWPWADSSIEAIRAHDIIEHLPNKIQTMNEMWRVLKPEGRAEIVVPTTGGTGAFQDPTHVSFWNRRSFLYYESGCLYRERFAKAYGITAAFKMVEDSETQTMDGPKLRIVLQAVK